MLRLRLASAALEAHDPHAETIKMGNVQ